MNQNLVYSSLKNLILIFSALLFVFEIANLLNTLLLPLLFGKSIFSNFFGKDLRFSFNSTCSSLTTNLFRLNEDFLDEFRLCLNILLNFLGTGGNLFNSKLITLEYIILVVFIMIISIVWFTKDWFIYSYLK